MCDRPGGCSVNGLCGGASTHQRVFLSRAQAWITHMCDLTKFLENDYLSPGNLYDNIVTTIVFHVLSAT